MVQALAACATAVPPVNVTRFHLDRTIERGTIFVEPAPGTDAASLEYGAHAAAVTDELRQIGYVPTDTVANALYVAVVGIERNTRAAPPRSSPVTIGVGGATGGGGGGFGGGLSIALGGGGPSAITASQLAVQLKRRADGTVMWEGRARMEAREKAPAAQPGLGAARLAAALFGGFPGESGRTITVP
ncbi:hypothetical protein GVO57_05440 [Sphingomonas changnyeongensis]|uniref:DUF4136 domain-containing protein n=1 Tax=Sphingomonas changnyeongensis TaxID=2698679 RepID=A0A7Z2NVA5_9SPHN|nr:hypothetical protein [Sphingomonas changnyeongensis]QHL90382.1 hypothetical protein GVO57_05440 [Sphingomonas changnyeongensis]